MTTSPTYHALTASPAAEQRLQALKDLKNTVIGNTWKKVDVAHDGAVLDYLLALLCPDDLHDATQVELVGEAATILGTLASVGTLTVAPLVAAHVPAHLVRVVHAHAAAAAAARAARRPAPSAPGVLAPVLRALRNVLAATADVLWGHMRGVGVEQRVVGTGLVGIGTPLSAGPTSAAGGAGAHSSVAGSSAPAASSIAGAEKGKAHADWTADARDALELVFEPANLAALLDVTRQTADARVLIPLYNLLARLGQLPRHRAALLAWRPADAPFPPSPTPPPSYLLSRLAASLPVLRAPKMIEAALELLGLLVQDESKGLAVVQTDTVLRVLEDLVASSAVGVRIAAAGCLTSILRAEQRAQPATKLLLLRTIQKLFANASGDDKIRLCFVLYDAGLQRNAADEAVPAALLEYLASLAPASSIAPASAASAAPPAPAPSPSPLPLGADQHARSLEAALLALASLAFQYEPTRVLIAEHASALAQLRAALAHASYGVRAAAAQLVRALSRTVALLRTSLVDAGIADALVDLLRLEVAANAGAGHEDAGTDRLGERARTVEVAATAALCNLVTDFSPLKATLVRDGGVGLLVRLAGDDYQPVAFNAVWALKNLVYHSPEALKMDVLHKLGASRLKALLAPNGPHAGTLRPQALELLQNLLADLTSPELQRAVDALGGDAAVLALLAAAAASPDADLAVPALAAAANLALGPETLRTSLAAHTPLMAAAAAALASESPPLVLAALRAVRALVESPGRRRPRQAVVDLVACYAFRARAREIVATARRTDVVHAALVLCELLDRAH